MAFNGRRCRMFDLKVEQMISREPDKTPPRKKSKKGEVAF